MGEPKKLESAKADNCASCHGTQKVLPASHAPVKGMTYSKCMDCHSKFSDAKKSGGILRGKMTLSHAHQLSGVGCNECHGARKPVESPEGQKCLQCHADFKTNFARADKTVPNPHDSHMGDLDCLLCHKVHAKSVNFCGQCHTWKYNVP